MPSLSERKLLRSLRRRTRRREQGLFLAEGARVVGDLLAAGLAVRLGLYTEAAAGDPDVAPLLDRLREVAAGTERVSEADLAGLADTVTPQGVLVAAEIPRRSWEDLRGRRLLVLDGVQDPGNLGTLVRTAEALGADGVLVLPGTTDPWGPKAVRAAAGSSFRLPLLEPETDAALDGLRRRGVPLWAADADGEPVRRDDPPPRAVALALGNEGAGLSAAVRAAADRTVAIAQAGGAESLNVAVAGALLMDRIFAGGRRAEDD
ncbi:MAG: RNA methyltransferase [Gemmatimonadota bacterium]|nr:RNA methyltransferase [Gemmatimonadota bacterium]